MENQAEEKREFNPINTFKLTGKDLREYSERLQEVARDYDGKPRQYRGLGPFFQFVKEKKI